jgi:hypothetical protein
MTTNNTPPPVVDVDALVNPSTPQERVVSYLWNRGVSPQAASVWADEIAALLAA